MTKILKILFEMDVVDNKQQDVILLSPSQAEGIAKVLDSLGIDPNVIMPTTSTKEEQPVMEAPVKIPLEIAPGTIEAAKRFFELGKKAGDWYYNASNLLQSSFPGNEQDLVLFTMILAATSVQNEVYLNFLEAVGIYQAIKKDMDLRPKTLRDFVIAVTDNEMSFENAKIFYSGLTLFKNIKVMKVISVKSKLFNIMRVLRLWTETGSLTKEQAKTALVNSLVSRDISKKELVQLEPEEWYTPNNAFIGKLKIANYALTLLDPDFASSDENPFNVVVDTWMWRVFFPEFLTKGMDQKLSGKILNKLFSSKSHYNKVAGLISQLAGEAGVSPHVMQAAIWTGIKMEWEGTSAEGETNYVASINSLIGKYSDALDGISDEVNKIATLLSTMTIETTALAINDRRGERIKKIVKNTNEKKRKWKNFAKKKTPVQTKE